MRITIDTQQDSHKEIRKAIRLLMSLVGDNEVYTNEEPKAGSIFDDSTPTESKNVFADMFGDSSPNPSSGNSSDDDEEQSEVMKSSEKPEDNEDVVEFY